MAYVVKARFVDLRDGKKLYLVGDKYPRDGLTVSDERLKSLASSDNSVGYPLIELVEEPEPMIEHEEPIKTTRKRVKKCAD